MNKKSLLMMMITICLIAVVGVGATLAYLTDTSEELVNTFTVGKVEISIDEPSFADDGRVDGILPGQVIPKDPTVTVSTDSADAYVFMSVTGISADFTVQHNGANGLEDGINPAWVKVDGKDNDLNGVYGYVSGKVVAGTELTPLFDAVKYDEDIETTNEDGYKIIVKAAAVQSENNEYASAKEEGVKLLTSAE